MNLLFLYFFRRLRKHAVILILNTLAEPKSFSIIIILSSLPQAHVPGPHIYPLSLVHI